MTQRWSHGRSFVIMALLAAAALEAQEKPDWKANYDSGVTAFSAGNYVTAVQLLAASREQARPFPPRNPRLASSTYMLALTYQFQGRLDLSEPLYLEAKSLFEAIGTEGRGMLAVTMDGLGQLRVQQARWKEAEALLRPAVELSGQSNGLTDPHTLTAMQHLGELFSIEGRGAEAEALLKQVVDTGRRMPSASPGMLASALRDLASAYFTTGRYPLAETLLQESMDLASKLGEANPSLADSLLALARLYRLEHKVSRAEPLLKRAARIYEAQQDPYLASVWHELGLLAIEEGKYAIAKDYLGRSLAFYQTMLGPENIMAAFVQVGLAEAYLGERDYVKAEALIQTALVKERATLGESHAELARLYMVAGNIDRQRHRSSAADANYRQGLDIYRRNVPSDHPDLAQAERQYTQFAKGLRK